MQTFLPYPDFRECVRVLDHRRLGKQRVEAYQILRILLGLQSGTGWRNHPAVLMWTGYEEALKLYHNLCIEEWVARGFKNQMQLFACDKKPPMPPWLGNPRFHRSHQSNLLRKNPDYYRPFFRGVRSNIPYWWPTYNNCKGGFAQKKCTNAPKKR
ncbi:MAG: MSMEG_6728 family protein [Candidatus Sumerlaeaceae bacterium]